MKKVPKAPKGAPEWMVTYGDLMSLLMCFFVLLFSMSSLEATKMSAAVESLNSAFNITNDGRASNIDTVRERINRLNRGRFRGDGPEKSRVDVPRVTDKQGGSESPLGEESMYQYVPKLDLGQDKGLVVHFARGVCELSDQAKQELKKIEVGLAGLPNKIIVKGHTETGEHAGGYSQGIDLAYARAVNVRNYLISLGMKKNQFQILVLGEYEPLRRDQIPIGADPKAVNSVVEIAVSASLL